MLQIFNRFGVYLYHTKVVVGVGEQKLCKHPHAGTDFKDVLRSVAQRFGNASGNAEVLQKVLSQMFFRSYGVHFRASFCSCKFTIFF